MSIGAIMSNLFGGGQPTQQQAPAQQTPPGNIPPQQTQQMQSAPGNVNSPATTPQGDQNTNQQAAPTPEGLDKFNDLWKPVESPDNTGSEPMFNVKPEQLMEAAKKIDFTKVIQPNQLQAIAGGGQEAVQAFAQALNTVAQTVYAQNAHATTKIVEQAVTQAQERMKATLPQEFKRMNVSESLRSGNPALNHPAASPILGALEQQITQKYPNATAAEISQIAGDYLANFANLFAPKQQQQSTQTQASKGQDWDAWIQN